MSTTIKIKSVIVLSSFLTMMYVPQSSAAPPVTSSFMGKDSFGQMAGEVSENGNFFFGLVSAFQSVVHGNSNASVAGAMFQGDAFRGSECWIGFGTTESNIQFDKTGKLPQQVITSGTVLVTWNEYCSGSNAEFTETITFNGTMTGIRAEGERNWGNTHRRFGDGSYQINISSDITTAKAKVSNMSISSPTFGTVVTPDETWGFVGNGKFHSVEFIKF